MTTPGIVTFVETRGAGDGVDLDAIAARATDRGMQVRRLQNVDDPTVELLTIEGAFDLEPSDGGGARVWRFVDTLAVAQSDPGESAASRADG